MNLYHTKPLYRTNVYLSIIIDFLAIIGVSDNVNKGNFNSTLKKLPGKKVVVNHAVDELMANLDAVNAEVKTMIDAAAIRGDLNFQIDASKYSGGWNGINFLAY